MTPNFLSLSICHSLYAKIPMELQYADFLLTQYESFGLPETREVDDGESVIEYQRESTVSQPCECGAIGAKPISINGIIVNHKCGDCWDKIVADANAKRAEYEGMVQGGCDPRIASRRMLARK